MWHDILVFIAGGIVGMIVTVMCLADMDKEDSVYFRKKGGRDK